MKDRGILYIVAFIVVIALAIGGTKLQGSWGKEETASKTAINKQVNVIQLSEKGRPNAATMVIVGAPPLQPASHVDRWNPKLHQDSCLACHGKPETGAPTPTSAHFYDNDTKGKIFRDNCIQCHAQLNKTKTKTAFGK